MAKVIMPLGSSQARGQLAKIMVFFPWKSINAVRGYVIPSNPNTAGQQAQRAKLHAAVDMFHATSLSTTDKTAWNLFATIFSQVMSGFNTFVMKHIDGSIAAIVWKKVWAMAYTYQTSTTASIAFATDSTVSKLKMRMGTSKTFMPNLWTASAVGASQSFAVSGLVLGVVYFYQTYTNEANEDCWSGIYRRKHVA